MHKLSTGIHLVNPSCVLHLAFFPKFVLDFHGGFRLPFPLFTPLRRSYSFEALKKSAELFRTGIAWIFEQAGREEA